MQRESTSGQPTATWVDAEQLAGEFQTNQIAAEQAYQGKREAREFQRSRDDIAEIEGSATFGRIGNDLLFRFAAGKEGEVSKVKPRQLIVVEGTVTAKYLNYLLTLTDCTVHPYQFREAETPKPTPEEARHMLLGKSGNEVRQLLGNPDGRHTLTKKPQWYSGKLLDYSCDVYEHLCRRGNSEIRVYVIYFKVPSSGELMYASLTERNPNN